MLYPMGLDKCIVSCIYHYAIIQSIFNALNILWASLMAQFSRVQSHSHVWLFTVPQTTVLQASLSITNSQRLCPLSRWYHLINLILCHSLLLTPSNSPRIRVFSNESALHISSVQFSHSVMSDSFNPMNYSTPGLPVHHQLPEFTQTHVHWVGDTI